MGTTAATKKDLRRKEAEIRLELAEIFEEARKKTKFAQNLSAAARAAGISPSYLHKIEGAEITASANCYADLCRLYDLPVAAVLRKVGKIDPSLERRLLDRMDVLNGLLEVALSIPDAQVDRATRLLEEVVADESGEGLG